MTNTHEQWRPIPGLPGYEASNTGKIRSLKRGGRVLSTFITAGSRYPCVRIYHEKPKTVRVHRLIALAWVPQPENPSHTWVLHRDDNPMNNSAENLRWGGSKENQEDRLRNREALETREKTVKLTSKKVSEIRTQRVLGATTAALAAQYEVTEGCILHILQGRTWTHVPIDQATRQALEDLRRPNKHEAKVRSPRKNDVLTIDLVRQIRKLREAGTYYKDISKITGVPVYSVAAVCRGEAWANQA